MATDEMMPTATTTTNSGSQKRTGCRGSSFTPSEDEAIAKAWIAVSENPIVGTEQKGNAFFEGVRNIYNAKFKPANRELRTMESVKTRCKTIHKECMRFAGGRARVVRSHPTGVSIGDMVNMATALYNGVEINGVEDDCGKPFRFIQSWRILRKHDKYMRSGEVINQCNTDRPSPPSSVQSGAELIPEEDSVVPAVKERPVGRKRDKDNQRKAEETAKKIRLAAETVAAQKERNQALKRHYEILLFTTAPSGCDSSQSVEYFNTMRARVLSELRKEESTQNQDTAE